MGKVSLRTDIDNIRKGIITFIRFFDSLNFSPEDLPRDDFRALSEGDAILQNYFEILNKQKSPSAKELYEAQNNLGQINKVVCSARDAILGYILDNLSNPSKEQFKNYRAYAEAEKAWFIYGEFVKKQKLENFSLEKMQALIDRAKNPALILSVFLSRFDGLASNKFSTLQEAIGVVSDLINHTPRSEFNSMTPCQKAQECRSAESDSFKEQMNTPGFSSYDFDTLFNKLGAGNGEDKKAGQKLLDKLWKNYVDEKHGRIKSDGKIHYKNIVALWEQVRQRFYKASSPCEKLTALKPFTKLWCTFVPCQFYMELKELILKGLFDENGAVRYRVVRVIDNVTLTLGEDTPQDLEDLRDTIRDGREAYMRENKLSRPRNAYSVNIKDKTLRSLTQAQTILDDRLMRCKAFGPVFR